MSTSFVKLSREVRFGLHPGTLIPQADSHNGFAGRPILAGLAPFVAVTVTVAGPVDPATGMLVNIKTIDALVREHAIEFLRTCAERNPLATGHMITGLYACLNDPLFARQQTLDAVSLALSPYLRISILRQEQPMVRLSERFEFSASHRLHSGDLSEAENRQVFGRCNSPNGHGHNYELEVTIAGTPDGRGMLMPVAELQRLVNEHIIDAFDHKHLNLDCPDFQMLNPTVENIARVLYQRLKPHISSPHRLASLRLWETPKTMCEYSE